MVASWRLAETFSFGAAAYSPLVAVDLRAEPPLEDVVRRLVLGVPLEPRSLEVLGAVRLAVRGVLELLAGGVAEEHQRAAVPEPVALPVRLEAVAERVLRLREEQAPRRRAGLLRERALAGHLLVVL